MNFFLAVLAFLIHLSTVTWSLCISFLSVTAATRGSPSATLPACLMSYTLISPLKRPTATIVGYSGWVASALTQLLVSMLTSGLPMSIFSRSMFHVHSAPLCKHIESWSRRPYAQQIVVPLAFHSRSTICNYMDRHKNVHINKWIVSKWHSKKHNVRDINLVFFEQVAIHKR